MQDFPSSYLRVLVCIADKSKQDSEAAYDGFPNLCLLVVHHHLLQHGQDQRTQNLSLQ